MGPAPGHSVHVRSEHIHSVRVRSERIRSEHVRSEHIRSECGRSDEYSRSARDHCWASRSACMHCRYTRSEHTRPDHTSAYAQSEVDGGHLESMHSAGSRFWSHYYQLRFDHGVGGYTQSAAELSEESRFRTVPISLRRRR